MREFAFISTIIFLAAGFIWSRKGVANIIITFALLAMGIWGIMIVR